jgi:RNA polymerase sigma-70 factor (ECF subfamily)
VGRDGGGATVLDAADAVVAAHRAEWGTIVGGLIRLTGDWELAEECAQDAFARALERWPLDGVPQRPAAWLAATARNRALDRLRRSSLEIRKAGEVAALAGVEPPAAAAQPLGPLGPLDDELALVFTCCHPALAMEARVALTLRAVGGLTTAEIARAFLVPERTMTQRLFRAKRKIRDAAIPFRVPAPAQLAERLDGVLAVLYLVFNEGYHASGGADVSRVGLVREAIRLTALLTELLPGEPEVEGLLALMELHDARRAGRVDPLGDIVPLDVQDRARWDHARIVPAAARLDAALALGRPGPYQLQAAIAACHATAAGAEDTDWAEIAALFGRLCEFMPGPVVELNRAVAVAMAHGPAAGLAIVDELTAAGALPGYHLLPAARADLLRRLGRPSDAAAAYRQALALVTNEAERRFLQRRLAEVLAMGHG